MTNYTKYNNKKVIITFRHNSVPMFLVGTLKYTGVNESGCTDYDAEMFDYFWVNDQMKKYHTQLLNEKTTTTSIESIEFSVGEILTIAEL